MDDIKNVLLILIWGLVFANTYIHVDDAYPKWPRIARIAFCFALPTAFVGIILGLKYIVEM